jgi:hypothetical protein
MSHRHAKYAAERFVADTKLHAMEIKHEHGIYRHLKCTKGGSSVYRFDIVTWPGYLAVSGDMGEYVFTRLPDMFDFFRSPKGEINIPYWAEKCEAADTDGRGVKQYEAETAREMVERRIRERYDNDGRPRKQLKDALEMVRAEVTYHEGAVRFHDSLRNLELPGKVDSYSLFDEYSVEEYTFHFIWVLHAIVWAINKYDEQKAMAPAIQGATA